MSFSSDNLSRIGELIPQLPPGKFKYLLIFKVFKFGKMFWNSKTVNSPLINISLIFSDIRYHYFAVTLNKKISYEANSDHRRRYGHVQFIESVSTKKGI